MWGRAPGRNPAAGQKVRTHGYSATAVFRITSLPGFLVQHVGSERMNDGTTQILKRSYGTMYRLVLLAGVAAALCFLGLLDAQSPNASLTGRFTDPSKAIIIEVRVAAINVGTNIRYETMTNGTGEYYIPNLPPGTYRIEAQKTGFNTVIKPDVVLHVQEAVEI